MSARRPEIRITERAQRDIENILLYTRRTWGGQQTATYRRVFAKTWSLLRTHPLLGQSHDELFAGCRSVRVEQHVVYYHLPRDGVVEVLRILHDRQDPAGKVEEPRA